MGVIIKGVFGGLLAFFGTAVLVYFKLNSYPKVPVYPDTWWGTGDPTKEDTTIRPFKIDISQSVSVIQSSFALKYFCFSDFR